MPTAYEQLREMKAEAALEIPAGDGRLLFCPDMGARVFGELGGLSLHRLDLDTAANPTDDFNNYGGLNLWPAPEGGRFGFNYDGDRWYVQDGINRAPFGILERGDSRATAVKEVVLTNRVRTSVSVRIERQVAASALTPLVEGLRRRATMACTVADTIHVANDVTMDQALIAAWTLEQFDANNTTTAFCQVARPEEAINFDFYEHPGDRIAYLPRGFTYRTDGGKAGQIGIKVSAEAAFIGFFDASRNLLCVRENLSTGEGAYFNIADNDQPDGPLSAADKYSIFNSDPDMMALELETVGAAQVENGLLKGSSLVSRTTYALLAEGEGERFMREQLA